MNKLRWGMLGAARIAPKNWKAIYLSGNNVVAGVATRDPARTKTFIESCQKQYPLNPAPEAFESYERLLASKNVDAVYIPLPTGLRTEWVVRAAKAGKHVLCEKPCAPTVADLQEMLSACRENGVQFMDGVMFSHHPRLAEVRAVLDDGESVGEIRRINSHFSFLAAEGFAQKNIRANAELEPLGCLGDLGWYCARIILWAMNWQMPRRVSARTLSGFDNGVPEAFSADLWFDGSATAGFYCSFTASEQANVVIGGTKGFLRMQDFVHPFAGSKLAFETTAMRSISDGCDSTTTVKLRPYAFASNASEPAEAHDARMFRHFAEAVLSGKLNADWPVHALKTQQVVNACMESARIGSQFQLPS